jgi:hypothetical protein
MKKFLIMLVGGYRFTFHFPQTCLPAGRDAKEQSRKVFLSVLMIFVRIRRMKNRKLFNFLFPTIANIMEVHHHSHTPRKKWTHYFWEFLMLFLAVLCGFFAENIREHYIENKRERKYIRSLINDLKADTTALSNYIILRKGKAIKIDSLVYLLTSGKHKEMGAETYFYARWITRVPAFVPSNGTIQQLKNSGSFRLVKDQSLIDSILAYDGRTVFQQHQDEVDVINQNKFKDIGGEIFRADIFYHIMDSTNVNIGRMNKPSGNPQLLTEDSKIINKIAFLVQYEAAVLKINSSTAQALKNRAARLLKMLEEKYKLD